MKFLTFLFLAVGSLLLTSCGTRVTQTTVDELNLKRYAGEWHEIGRLPNFFERDVVAAKAIYQERAEGGLSVKNLGVKVDGDQTSITGKATRPDSAAPGKLKVRFDRFPANLFAGDYWVLTVSSDYRRAMVGSPNQKYLWLLSKNPNDTQKDFVNDLKRAKDLGYSTSELIFNPKRIR